MVVKWLKRNYIEVIVLCLLVLIAYLNSVNNTLISDDVYILTQNPEIATPQYFLNYPLSMVQGVLYFIIFKVSGSSPVLFRLSNITFHLLNVLTLYALLRHISKKWIAFFTAALFAVHPVLTESVTWISGGGYARYTFFFLLSFYCYIRAKLDKRWYLASILLFFLSLESSIKAVVLPVVLLLYEFTLNKKMQSSRSTFPFIALAGIFFVLSYTSIAPSLDQLDKTIQYSKELHIYDYNLWLQIPIAITTYLSLIFWPANLSFLHTEVVSYTELSIQIIALAIYIAVTVFTYFKNKQIFFWLSFFLITLLPTLIPIGLASSVAERYVYLGSIGIFFVIAYGLDYLLEVKKKPEVVWLTFCFLIIMLTVGTVIRNNEWKTFESFWKRTAETSPMSYQARNNLGNIYMKQNQPQLAIPEYIAALKILPNRGEIYQNIGIAYLTIGDNKNAAEAFTKAIEHTPTLVSFKGLTLAYFNLNEFDKARQVAEKTISLIPNNHEAYTDLGVIYLKLGDKLKAKQALQKALELNPADAKAQDYLNEATK